MKQALANVLMVLITIFGLLLMCVVRIIEGVLWVWRWICKKTTKERK